VTEAGGYSDDQLLAGVRDGRWLSEQDFSAYIDASELLDEQRCSPQCLLAREPSECECRCCGEFHGVLAFSLIPAQARRPWHSRHCGWADSHLDEQCPVIKGGVPAFNRAYQVAKRACEPLAVVQPRGERWEMTFDSECEHYGNRLADDAIETWNALVLGLLRARRLRSATGGGSLLIATGVRDRTDAQVLGVIARELLCNNLDGARSCLRALAEDGHAG
jgi:hypothetical protein